MGVSDRDRRTVSLASPSQAPCLFLVLVLLVLIACGGGTAVDPEQPPGDGVDAAGEETPPGSGEGLDDAADSGSIERGFLYPSIEVVERLEEGRPVFYRLDLEVDQLLDLRVTQRGWDIVVRLVGPAGTALAEVDGRLGTVGDEPVLWIAQEAGTHRLELVPARRESPSAEVVLELAPPRAATGDDRARAEAARLLYDASGLDREGGLVSLDEAVEGWRRLDDTGWHARALHALALGHLLGKDYEPARRRFEELLAFEDLHPARRAWAHHSLAEIDWDLGIDLEAARQSYRLALEAWDTSGSARGKALTLNNLGWLHLSMRDVGPALRLLNQALGLWQAQDDLYEQGVVLNNRGRVYQVQGKLDQALADLRRAVGLFETSGNRAASAAALNGIGWVEHQQGHLAQAIETFKESLRRRKTDRGRALSLLGLGRALVESGHPEEAESRLLEALELFGTLNDGQGEAEALRLLGRQIAASRPEQARARLERALEQFGAIGDCQGTAASKIDLARLERSEGRLGQALELSLAALDEIEGIRASLSSELHRSSYLQTRQGYYDLAIALLMELEVEHPEEGHQERAFLLSEQARARSLIDMLALADIEVASESSQELLEQRRALERSIAATQLRLERAGSGDPELRRQLDNLLTELAAVKAEIRRADPKFAALELPRPLSIREIQVQLLDDESLLLEFHLAEEQGYLWAISHDSVTTHRLPPRAEIARLAEDFRRLLELPATAIAHRGATERIRDELSEALLAPVEGLGRVSKLLIVTEGALQKVPFSALLSPQTGLELVTSHEINQLPSASALPLLRSQESRDRASKGMVAVVAAPRFLPAPPSIEGVSTSPVTRSAATEYSELPFSLEEARAILELAKGYPSFGALGTEATKEAVIEGGLGNYRYLHIATHGVLDLDYPELSSLVFSRFDEHGRRRDDTLLRAHEVYGLDLDNELVVLSACQTAGGAYHREGLLGWSQGFLYAGARRVMVSLWQVDDESTAVLMERFYRALFLEEMTPSAALRQAQDQLRKDARWRHPRHWAAFVLIGEFL